MASVNFGNFNLTAPQIDSYFIGYRDTTEIRTTIGSLTALNIPYFNNIGILNDKSLSYDSAYTSFNQNSSRIDSGYQTTNSLSGLWNEAYTYTNTNSASIEELKFNMTDVIVNSANWQGAYFFSLGSATFIDTIATASAYKVLSAAFLASYTTTLEGSALWYSSYTTVNEGSAFWDSTYNTFHGTSATWEGYLSDLAANSGFWNQSYVYTLGSSIQINAALAATQYKEVSASYVTFQNLSTANVSISAVTILESLSVVGDLIVFANLPTSSTGLPTGAVYTDGGFLKIV